MKNTFLLISSLLMISSLSSCMLASAVTAPIKVAGDIAEGTYNVGKGAVTTIAGGNEE